MREPRFWARDVDPRSREAAPLLRFMLTPFSWLYAEATHRRIARATPLKVRPTVICVGNLTAGGVGKSPIVAALRAHFEATTDLRVATLSRGYKGKLKGPLKVDPDVHTSEDVGDEPIMLAKSGESWIGADRAATGQDMSNDGVDIIIMDDGHQNPGLHKDLSLIVVDAAAGFGNGHVIPKGPLREPIAEGLARADAIIVMGYGQPPAEVEESNLPVFSAVLAAQSKPSELPYVAFAGIGRPEKFFDTLKAMGADVRDAVPFPDHHKFTDGDLNYLRRLAGDYGATLITTDKDLVRLSAAQQTGILSLPVEVIFDRRADLDKMLENVIKPGRDD
ncbi:MAG: tetraacyldisaccharide 4'-kinase [Hyphomonadaceae bacterium]|nr:tetraacyldisaccharide 4'-kinase [Hyphomonadaceae bacterium]